jgi:hypothetical protein
MKDVKRRKEKRTNIISARGISEFGKDFEAW